ncbi:hypothetical protein BRADI_4g16635v3 [Brachypodium distachyon]|uniref:Uncharacterized protein n=1 Tax=Brachypodium distachyon TaxID=15368 RepID=A0A2K2CNA4_BRADI|nr:hypothetical protein BRADI_4g16635v3 [Brachypodium distachyon]
MCPDATDIYGYMHILYAKYVLSSIIASCSFYVQVADTSRARVHRSTRKRTRNGSIHAFLTLYPLETERLSKNRKNM